MTQQTLTFTESKRLGKQLECVKTVALELKVFTLPQLVDALYKRYPGMGFLETGVSARLRELRKHGCKVPRPVAIAPGLFEYTVEAA